MSTATYKSGNARTATAAFRSDLSGKHDTLLVAAAKNGEAEAFELLAERHKRMILLMALRTTGNREDAEDVAQQSFQKAFVHLTEFEGRSSFSTWLTRIALNEAFMLTRNRRRWRETTIDESSGTDETMPALEVADSRQDPERSYSQREQHQLLSAALNELAPGIRKALQSCDLSERSIGETARILGVSAAAVKSRLHRGRRILRERLSCRIKAALVAEE